MQESPQTPQGISLLSTPVLCDGSCSEACRKRKRGVTLDLILPKVLKQEARSKIKVGPVYKRRNRIPDEITEIGIEEDFEAEWIHPLDFDLWLWKCGFSLDTLRSLTSDLDKTVTDSERLNTVKNDKTFYFMRYRLFCRESSLDDEFPFVLFTKKKKNKKKL